MKWILFYSSLLLVKLMGGHKVSSIVAASPSWPRYVRQWSELSSIPLSPLHDHLMVGHEVKSPLFLSTSLPWIFMVNSLLAVSHSWPPHGRPWSELYSIPLSPLHGHLIVGHEVNSLKFLSPSWPIHGSHEVNSLIAKSPSWPPHGRHWSELSSIPLSFFAMTF